MPDPQQPTQQPVTSINAAAGNPASPRASSPLNPRRHDLDALRALAMLSGIALHGALAYMGGGWVVSDERGSRGLGDFVNATHGFRMPLFFLLSGFFTAMLWQRRGLDGLMSQRVRRIFIPLVIGCLTIVPAMNAVTRWAVSQKTEQIRQAAGEPQPVRERAPSPDIWTVAAYGDMEGLRAYKSDSPELNTPDPMYGVTALGWTAIKDMPEATRYLLEIGANPSALYKDGNTPMHTACFFGRADVAEQLLRAGADLTVASAAGERPADSMRHNQQTTEFIANLLKLPIKFEDVAAGRERIRVMMEDPKLVGGGASGKAASGATGSQDAGSGGWLARWQNDVFFHHLWFLWLLCWLTVGFAAVVLVAGRLSSVKLPRVLFGAPLCLLWLVPVTALVQSQMQMGRSMPGFGPDTSAGLMPIPHVLLYYAVFFGFGAMLFIARGAETRIGRWWLILLPAGLAILPLGLRLGMDQERAAALIPDAEVRRWAFLVVQASYAWLMSLGLLGLCETVFAKDRPWVRYISDSSYWLYLTHLPVIIAGQVLLLRIDLPPLVEFAIVTITTTGLLLVVYHFAVRYTPIGTLLNGTRVRG